MSRKSIPERTFWVHVAFIHNRVIISFCNCIGSSYFWACLIYLLFCETVVSSNLHSGYLQERVFNNNHYILALVRVLNSWMFMLTWKDKGWVDVVMYPEYLDFVSSVILLWAAAMYGAENLPDYDGEIQVRYLETVAWGVEVIASIGWFLSWHKDYTDNFGSKPLPSPNRGWTFDDPDIIANITNVLASVIYFIHSWQVLSSEDLSLNTIYQVGDVIYLINAWIYLVVAMRDCECFWFMPAWGRLSTLDEIMMTDSSLYRLKTSTSMNDMEDSDDDYDDGNAENKLLVN